MFVWCVFIYFQQLSVLFWKIEGKPFAHTIKLSVTKIKMFNCVALCREISCHYDYIKKIAVNFRMSESWHPEYIFDLLLQSRSQRLLQYTFYFKNIILSCSFMRTHCVMLWQNKFLVSTVGAAEYETFENVFVFSILKFYNNEQYCVRVLL